MQAFKAYLKIVWRIKWQIAIYFGVFVAMAFSFGLTSGNRGAASFGETLTLVAWIDEGEPSALGEGMKAAIAPYAQFVEVGTDPLALQDALFYRKAEVILRVPADFEAAFMRGDAVKVSRTTVPDSTGGFAIDMRVEKYLNTARVYRDNLPGLSAEALTERTLADLAAEAQATYFGGHVIDRRVTYVNNFFNYISYTMLMIMILGITATMLAFNSPEIHRRNAASPVSMRRISRQLYAGSLVLAAVASTSMYALGVTLYRDVLTGWVPALLWLNVALFSVVALSVSFLVSTLIRNANAANAVANVIGLGSSFLGGAFVPQAMLGQSVLFIASFTPTYWFIKANNDIFALARLDWQSLSPVAASMGVEVLFAVAIFLMTQVFVKSRKA